MPAGPCVFCEIVAGERAAEVVLDHGEAFAFLDVRPVFKGHVLVVPRTHVELLPDLPTEHVGPYFAQVQRVAVVHGLGAAGTFVAINNKISQSVPHLHSHVVPRNPKDGLRGFFWPRTKYASDAEMSDYARRIAASL
jgi:histidine triad (HIT) family protein